jgi:hypothetical protein
MDCLSRCIEYRNLMDGVKISGEEHLKVILLDSSTYLKKATDVRNGISSDPNLQSDYREIFLREVNGYIEKVEQANLTGSKDRQANADILSLLTHLVAVGVGYYLGYNKKSDETVEKQQFISDVSAALKEELKKYL